MNVLYQSEVIEFIGKLEKPTQAKILRSIELIEQYGRNLGMPHVRKVTTRLYELRIRGRQEIRIFYFFHKENAFLVHGIIKKTQKIPKREVETAMKRIPPLTDI